MGKALSDITDPRVTKSHELVRRDSCCACCEGGVGVSIMAGDVEGFALFAPPVGISEQVVIATHLFF